MIRLCYSRQKLRGGYVGKARPLIETKQRAKHGGAGGIRTHEWRFCRPLPWATWVPRRTFNYSEYRRKLSGRISRLFSAISSSPAPQNLFSLRGGIAPLLPAAWD